MTTATLSFSETPSSTRLQQRFLRMLPRIEAQARYAFRDVTCAQRRADAVAETVAFAWLWFTSLTRRGKDATAFVSALATLASRAVRGGRRLSGQERARDALSRTAQRRHGFRVEGLVGTLAGNAWDEALIDNTQSPVPEQVCFRVDFPRWRRQQSQHDRHVIDGLVVGEKVQDVARQNGVTAGRVSQLRRRWHLDWERFCDDEHTVAAATAN